jgi:Tol biopolymer transport system component
MNSTHRFGLCIVIALLLLTVLTAGVQGTVYALSPFISADGRYVVYDSGATGLVSGDTNGKFDIFVRDRQTGTTTLVSKS